MRCKYVLNLHSYIFTVLIVEDECRIEIRISDALGICSVAYTLEKKYLFEHVRIACSTLPMYFFASGECSPTCNQTLDALSKVFKESIVLAEQCVE